MDEPQDIRGVRKPSETLHRGAGVAGRDDVGFLSSLEEVSSDNHEFREEGPFWLGGPGDESLWKLNYDIESFLILNDHCIFLLQSEDCDAMLEVGPWIIAGQILAVEAWVPDFILGMDLVMKTMVWIRQPNLPLEYWDNGLIL